MCGIIARDKRTGEYVKKPFEHYGDAVSWLYKYCGRRKKYTLENMLPKKTSAFWNNRARIIR